MYNRNSIKAKKVICAVIIIICAILLLYFFVNSTSLGYYAYKDTECIGVHNLDEAQLEENILFSYENSDAEILLYDSPKTGFYKYHIVKKKILGNTKYKMRYGDNIEPDVYSQEVYEVNKNLSYICVQYERDIENVDFQGCKPIYSEIEITNYDGTKSYMYICIIDKTENGKITRNSYETDN